MHKTWLNSFGDSVEQKKTIAAIVVLIGGCIGLLASFVLSTEAILLAKNSHTVLSCDINSALSCSSVANHWSASVLGFPNSFVGMMTFPVVITIAVAFLAKVRFPRWFMQATLAGVAAGILFAGWMLYMSYFEIRILCPWCLTTDASMLLIFYGVNRYVTLGKDIKNSKMHRFVSNGYDTVALVSIIFLVIIAIILKYGSQLF